MKDSSLRQQRKAEHLEWALKGKLGQADFSDLELIHNCLPEAALDEVQLKTSLAGLPMKTPLFINALTGGTEDSLRINRSLARVAREGGFAMAVGSQMAGIRDDSLAHTFKVVRKTNPKGIIWANLGAYADISTATRAVDMIDADGIQIHLNVPQELAMHEGDTTFKGTLERLEKLCRDLKVPVMVKEVGFGIAREQALQLENAGVKVLDVGGKGGTNFLLIEQSRRKGGGFSELVKWGLPTPVSLMETLDAVYGRVEVMASGGITGSLEAVKALALGARATGIAGMALKILMKYGEKALWLRLKRLEREIRSIMLMTGSTSLHELTHVPLVSTGYTAEWLEKRGVDPGRWSRR